MYSDYAEIKLTQFCIKLVFYLTYTTMHGNTKVKPLDSLSSYCLHLSPSLPQFQLPPLIILLQPLFGLPLTTLSLGGGFQLRTSFSMAEEFLLKLFPIHFHFSSLTCIATDFSHAHLISSFEVTSYQKVFRIFLRYLFIYR